ncbi:MAG TPA: DUF255 domain-containing protein [Patescibacteria group bacterium]|nr:DUF255 domain-containing protein [Patescibacteria group bacterium]
MNPRNITIFATTCLYPLDRYPWGGEAITRAVASDKPILLSIGYSTCHW